MSQTAMVTIESNDDGKLSGPQMFVVKSGQELIPREGLVITKITVEFPVDKSYKQPSEQSNSKTD